MKRSIKFYNSFEEQEEDSRSQLAMLSSSELMIALRKLINMNFGMSGFNINNLPKKHTIKIIQYQSL